MGALLAILGLGVAGLLGAIFLAATRPPEEAPPEEAPPEEEEAPPEEEEVEVIDATLESGNVLWAALTEWKRVHTRYPNEWPADTDITLAWEVKNIGNVGAYFQAYMFSPGEWYYIDPNDSFRIFEEFHTPAVPIVPGYNYYHINILGRKLDGERIGAVWTSEEVEVTYV